MTVGKRIKLGLAAGVLTPLLSMTGATAILSTDGSAHVQEDGTEIRLTQAEADQPAHDEALRESRIQERQAARGTRLTTAQQTRLRERCQAAQTALTAHQEKAAAVQRSRTNAYDNINDHLNALITNIEPHTDTAKLQAIRADFNKQQEAFKLKFAEYMQALDDLARMDCQVNPAGFKASLDSARTIRTELKQQAVQIRTLVRESLKAELQAVRQAIREQQGEVIN